MRPKMSGQRSRKAAPVVEAGGCRQLGRGVRPGAEARTNRIAKMDMFDRLRDYQNGERRGECEEAASETEGLRT